MFTEIAVSIIGCENDVTQASSLQPARIPQCSIDVPSVSCRSTTVFGVKFKLTRVPPVSCVREAMLNNSGNVARASSPCLKRHSQDGYATFSAAGNTSTVNAKGSYSVIDGSTPMKNSAVTNSELFYHRSLTVNQNTIALSSDRGSLEIGGVSLLYEGSRVKSYLLGRDLNPMGRGDGSLYAQGMFSAGNTRPKPNANPIGGFGNSVNNGCGCGGDKPCIHKAVTFEPDTPAKTTPAVTAVWIPWDPPYVPGRSTIIPCPLGALVPYYECCWVDYYAWHHGCPAGTRFECIESRTVNGKTCWHCMCQLVGAPPIPIPEPSYPDPTGNGGNGHGPGPQPKPPKPPHGGGGHGDSGGDNGGKEKLTPDICDLLKEIVNAAIDDCGNPKDIEGGGYINFTDCLIDRLISYGCGKQKILNDCFCEALAKLGKDAIEEMKDLLAHCIAICPTESSNPIAYAECMQNCFVLEAAKLLGKALGSALLCYAVDVGANACSKELEKILGIEFT